MNAITTVITYPSFKNLVVGAVPIITNNKEELITIKTEIGDFHLKKGEKFTLRKETKWHPLITKA